MNTPTNLSKRNETAPERVQQRATIAPLVDVYENKDELYLFADMPGVTKDDVKVHLEKGQLTIEGKRSANGEPTRTALATEWRPADYYRAFSVSDAIDVSKIDAKLSNGVLRVRLPRSEGTRPRQIPVKAG